MLVAEKYWIPEYELEWHFVQSPGPGGQNVNKTATAAILGFRLAESTAFPMEVKARLMEKLAKRLTPEGVLTVRSHGERSQVMNRREAERKLAMLLAEALIVRTPRRPTKPTMGSVKRRLEGKKRRADIKKGRGDVGHDGNND